MPTAIARAPCERTVPQRRRRSARSGHALVLELPAPLRHWTLVPQARVCPAPAGSARRVRREQSLARSRFRLARQRAPAPPPEPTPIFVITRPRWTLIV